MLFFQAARVSFNCSFCGKEQQEVQRLVAGPGGVYVCNECVGYGQAVIARIADTDVADAHESRPLIATDEGRCSFCGKQRTKVARLFAGPGGVRICNECLNLCSEIFAEERRHRPEDPRR